MNLRKRIVGVRGLIALILGLLPVFVACTPAVSGNPADYSIQRVSGQVIRWNPCSAVHWRADLRIAPAGSLATVKAAVAKLSSATGIPFVYDGSASYIPQKGVYSQPAPLVVSFARRPGRALASNYLTGGTNIGYGGRYAVAPTGHPFRITTGYVVIDADQYRYMSSTVKAGLLIHELGHAAGLNHARQKAEIMYPVISNSSPTNYAAGDRTGLKLLGRSSGCIS